jgi:hypothetical protein
VQVRIVEKFTAALQWLEKQETRVRLVFRLIVIILLTTNIFMIDSAIDYASSAAYEASDAARNAQDAASTARDAFNSVGRLKSF